MRKMHMIIGALLITVLLVLGACAAPAVTEEEVAELQNQITSLEQELSAKEATVVELQSQITSLEQELSAKEATVAELESQITSLEEAVAAAEVAPPEEEEEVTPTTAPLVNKQPQGILGTYGRFQITSHSSERSDTEVKVVGEVLGIGSIDVIDCEIKVEFYDAAGTLLDTAVQILKKIAPNEMREFEVECPDPQNVASYKIAVSMSL